MTPSLIKNRHLVEDQLSAKDLRAIEEGAFYHRMNNINFKFTGVGTKRVTIQVFQGKTSTENYFDQKRLREIVHELFDQFFPGKKIDAHATPYREPASNVVDIVWINKKMLETGTKLKTIEDDTGIASTQISRILNGRAELSQPMKALFWYYFLDRARASKGK